MKNARKQGIIEKRSFTIYKCWTFNVIRLRSQRVSFSYKFMYKVHKMEEVN